MSITIPEGLEVPPEGQFEAPATFEVMGGELMLVAIAGVPVGEADEPMEEEIPPDFLAAVEQSIGE
jgi:hypothetical protein